MIDLIRRIALRPFYCVLCVLGGLTLAGASSTVWAPWLAWVAFALICCLAIGTFIVTASIRNVTEAAIWVVLFIAVGVVAGFLTSTIFTTVTMNPVLFGAAVTGALLWIFCLIPKQELPA